MGFFKNLFGPKTPPQVNVRAGMYREPVSQCHISGSAVIQDNGVLTSTAAGSSGDFLFTEVGCGPRPLVLLGQTNDINLWLARYRKSGIDNRIRELPGIYMGVQPYKPGARFKGLFPLHDSVNAVVQGLAAFAPGSDLTDIVGAAKDFNDARGFEVKTTYSSAIPKANYRGVLYVKFHYLQCKDMSQVGERKVSFELVEQVLKTMV